MEAITSDNLLPEAHVEPVDNPERSRFELAVDGDIAVAEYRLAGDTITFTHTEVPEGLRGRGVGEKLVRAALDSAKRRKLSVVPRCRFIADFIRGHPEYQDLVRKG